MTEHTVKSYDQELRALEGALQRMGELALSQVEEAVKITVAPDPGRAEAVIARDPQLDRLEEEVERAVVRLIALRQPMGSDLRDTVTAIKIASNLERVGDLAKSIAKRILAMSKEPAAGIPTNSLERLGEAATGQLRQVLSAANQHDPDVADRVWASDRGIDELYESLFREMLTYMMGTSDKIAAGAHLLFVAKNLERVGDHATNIAEELHFKFTGQPMDGLARPRSTDFA